ncbi:LSU ribosomal protein L25p [Sinorhizobium sojae CCBAU 05684]|uniref:Large ribosomal subunit protein bL25 n=2 Tax=Sinorhizobium sojae TaxID=716925 RepID=A0A249PD15_9HYPH|nr:LSU ribosomal protein L25p [Sinorhizobium sojae CCBAU 05684]
MNSPNNQKGLSMSQSYELKAETRERVGKGSSRELRRNGLIPAVIYGDKQPPLSIALSTKDVTMKIHAGGFMTTVATIDVNGEKIRVLPKDYQLDPVRDFTMHVDFLRVSKGSQVSVQVPVHFENEEKSPGLKRGGALNIVRHEVELNVSAEAIPEFLTVDLTGLNIGDTVHISNVKLPAGATPVITDRDFTIATITGRVQEAEETEVEGEAEA